MLASNLQDVSLGMKSKLIISLLPLLIEIIAARSLKNQLRTVTVIVLFISSPIRLFVGTWPWSSSSGDRSHCSAKSFNSNHGSMPFFAKLFRCF
jgi:hypothetical protein